MRHAIRRQVTILQYSTTGGVVHHQANVQVIGFRESLILSEALANAQEVP